MSNNNNTLTAEEEALYDRQLRVWGKDAQYKLRNSTVLISPLNGLALEIIKNLCLAGIGNIIICDFNNKISNKDYSTSFTTNVEKTMNQSRVHSSINVIKGFNPHVNITIEEGNYILIDIIKKYDNISLNSIILCNSSIDEQILISNYSREKI